MLVYFDLLTKMKYSFLTFRILYHCNKVATKYYKISKPILQYILPLTFSSSTRKITKNSRNGSDKNIVKDGGKH